jgi:hypothetical protein
MVSMRIAGWPSGLLASVLAVAALTGLVGLLHPHVSAQHLFVLYVLPVMVIAMKWGTGLDISALLEDAERRIPASLAGRYYTRWLRQISTYLDAAPQT